MHFDTFRIVADFTVLEVVKEFEAATGKKVAYDIVERRVGDVPSTYSTAALVEKELGWKANLTMKDMCKNFIHVTCSSCLMSLNVPNQLIS